MQTQSADGHAQCVCREHAEEMHGQPTILSSVIQRHRVSNQQLHLNLDSEDTNQPKDPRPCDLLLPPSL